MTWLGLADPVQTQERLRDKDPKLTALIRVATAWSAVFRREARTVSDAVSDAEMCFGAYEDQKANFVHPELRDAFLAVAARGGRINKEALGKYLASSEDRVVPIPEPVRFERQGMRQGAVVWGLAEVPLIGIREM